MLRAALLQGEDAIEAWRAWKKGVVLASLDHNSQRLLPLLSQNLIRHGISDPLMTPLSNLYRYNALRNQGFLRDLTKALEFLRAQGIAVMVLKGMALAIGYYGDIGLRPMYDLDLLVKQDDALRAIELLVCHGWRTNPEKGPPFQDVGPAYLLERHFKNKFGTEIDLHWKNPQERRSETDDSYWEEAVELKAMKKSFLAMNPTGILFFTMAHGIKHRGTNAPRMIADMHTILVKSGPDIQWDLLATKIKQNGLSLPARYLFKYMNNLLYTPISSAFQNQLDSIKMPSRDWYAFYALNNLPSGPEQFFISCINLTNDYQRNKIAYAARPLSVAEYLKLRWKLNHVREVPCTFITKAGHHILQMLKS